jgi:hypothetical protein
MRLVIPSRSPFPAACDTTGINATECRPIIDWVSCTGRLLISNMVIIQGAIKRASTIVSILAEKPPIMLASDVKENIRTKRLNATL